MPIDVELFKKSKDMRDLQRELTRNGEMINETNTVTYSEKILGQALIDHGIKLVPSFKLSDKEFDIKLFDYPILIEVDGSIHNNVNKRQKDYSKDRMAQIKGFKVLRFSNEEIKNISGPIKQIQECIKSSGKQPRIAFIYPLTFWEQIKMWWIRKIKKKKIGLNTTLDGVIEYKIRKFHTYTQEKIKKVK